MLYWYISVYSEVYFQQCIWAVVNSKKIRVMFSLRLRGKIHKYLF